MPDLTIVIDLDFKTGIQRSLKRNNKETRFEFKESSFHKKVSVGFKKLGKKKKVKIFNGDKSKNEIHKNIVDFLNKKRILNKQIPYCYDN